MFEKEAEELFKKKPLGYEMKPELEIYKDGYKDGYNKAKKEMQEQIEKMQEKLKEQTQYSSSSSCRKEMDLFNKVYGR